MTETTIHYQPYIDETTGQVTPMSPANFAADYTRYYAQETNDSPELSRQHLIDRLLTFAEKMLETQPQISILDIGAGRQVLENELQKEPRFKRIQSRVKIVTLDIAKLSASQLLAKDVLHVTADGSQLPFASGFFDIVYSSMAIDFMPRHRAFSEVRRVVKPHGKLVINFHHPDLIAIKEREKIGLRHQLKQVQRRIKQIQTYGKNSSKLDQRISAQESERDKLQRHIDHITAFFGQIFPELIFESVDEIIETMTKYFPHALIKVDEFSNVSVMNNGWFATDIHLRPPETEE